MNNLIFQIKKAWAYRWVKQAKEKKQFDYSWVVGLSEERIFSFYEEYCQIIASLDTDNLPNDIHYGDTRFLQGGGDGIGLYFDTKYNAYRYGPYTLTSHHTRSITENEYYEILTVYFILKKLVDDINDKRERQTAFLR